MAAFARCPACQTICGVMNGSEARDGGWLDVLDLTCTCGAAPERLRLVGEEEAVLAMEGGALPPLVLVKNGWRGTDAPIR